MFEGYSDTLTVDELCEMLYIGKNTAYHLLGSGELGAFQMGKTWKIPRDSEAKFIMKQGQRGK